MADQDPNVNQPNQQPNTAPTQQSAPSGPPAGFISVEEHKAGIEKARGEEKAKVYGKLETLEAENKKLTAELTSSKERIAKLEADLEAVSNAKTADGTVDVTKVIEDVTGKLSKKFAKDQQDKVAELEQRLKAQEDRNRQLELERVRLEAIREAGGEDQIVAALVGGNTPEEIRESVKKARETYQAILAKAGGVAQTQNTDNGSGSVPPTLGANNQTGAGRIDDRTMPTVRNMDTQEWAKNRKEVIANLKKKYQQ